MVNVSLTWIEETTKVIINRFLLTLLGHKSKQIVAETTKAIAEIAKGLARRGKKKCTTIELIRALIDLLKEDDIDILTQACRALGNICYQNENGKNMVRQQDGLKVILTVLKKGIALDNVEGARFLLIAANHLLLVFLKCEEALCIKVFEEGMLPIFCSILELYFRNGISNDEVLVYLCFILEIMDIEDIVFLDERLARGLVNIVTMDISFYSVTGLCLQIFRGQAWKDEKARLVLAKAGVWEWLPKLLQKHHPQSNDQCVRYYFPCIRYLLDVMLTGVDDVRARL